MDFEHLCGTGNRVQDWRLKLLAIQPNFSMQTAVMFDQIAVCPKHDSERWPRPLTQFAETTQ